MKKICVMIVLLGLFFVESFHQARGIGAGDLVTFQFNVTTSGTTGVHSLSTGLSQSDLNSSGELISINEQTTYDEFMDAVRIARGMANDTAFSVYLGDVDLSNKLQFKKWNMSQTNGSSLFVDYEYTQLLGDKYAGQFRVIDGSNNNSHMVGFEENGSHANFMSIIRSLCNFNENELLSVYTKSGVSDLSIEGNYIVWNFASTDGRTLYVIAQSDTASLNNLRFA